MKTSPRIEHRQAELEAFLAQWFGDSEPAAPERPARPAPVVSPRLVYAGSLSDDEVLVKARAAGNGAQFERLFGGDTSAHDGDDSAADLALCNMLSFWTGKDPDQMDRLFRLSGLYRPKWDHRHGRDTYGNLTIQKAIAGCRETYTGGASGWQQKGQGDHRGEWAGKSYAEAQPAAIDPAALLGRFEVKTEYVEKLGQEEFLIENLLIRQHILVVIAMSGGGKTAFWYRYAAPVLAGKGLSVWYLDADSPASEHKVMKEIADRHGFRFLNVDANVGAGIAELKKTLETIATSDCDLTGHVFIIDTLKKFTDLMSKGSVKDFFALCRKLTGKGATVVLLGHANKYRSKPEGHLIAEGVGDVRSDADELIFFERKRNENTGGLDVTTDPDPDHGAKVRGVFKPFSFHIGKDREVTIHERVVDMPDYTESATLRATEEEIVDAAAEFLAEAGEPVAQSTLVNQVRAMVTAGVERIRRLIVANSEKDGGGGRKRFIYTIGARGRLSYSLPQVAPEQGEMFDAEVPFRRESSFSR